MTVENGVEGRVVIAVKTADDGVTIFLVGPGVLPVTTTTHGDLNGGNVVGEEDRLLVDLGTGPSVQREGDMYDLLPPERDFSINLDAPILDITRNVTATHPLPRTTDTKMTTRVTIKAITMYFHLRKPTPTWENTLRTRG